MSFIEFLRLLLKRKSNPLIYYPGVGSPAGRYRFVIILFLFIQFIPGFAYYLLDSYREWMFILTFAFAVPILPLITFYLFGGKRWTQANYEELWLTGMSAKELAIGAIYLPLMVSVGVMICWCSQLMVILMDKLQFYNSRVALESIAYLISCWFPWLIAIPLAMRAWLYNPNDIFGFLRRFVPVLMTTIFWLMLLSIALLGLNVVFGGNWFRHLLIFYITGIGAYCTFFLRGFSEKQRLSKSNLYLLVFFIVFAFSGIDTSLEDGARASLTVLLLSSAYYIFLVRKVLANLPNQLPACFLSEEFYPTWWSYTVLPGTSLADRIVQSKETMRAFYKSRVPDATFLLVLYTLLTALVMINIILPFSESIDKVDKLLSGERKAMTHILLTLCFILPSTCAVLSLIRLKVLIPEGVPVIAGAFRQSAPYLFKTITWVSCALIPAFAAFIINSQEGVGFNENFLLTLFVTLSSLQLPTYIIGISFLTRFSLLWITAVAFVILLLFGSALLPHGSQSALMDPVTAFLFLSIGASAHLFLNDVVMQRAHQNLLNEVEPFAVVNLS